MEVGNNGVIKVSSLRRNRPFQITILLRYTLSVLRTRLWTQLVCIVKVFLYLIHY